MTRKGTRFDALVDAIKNEDGVVDIQLDEDWLPPHKMAGFTPYDAIVSLEDTEERWTQTKFDDLLAQHRVQYDKVIILESDGDGSHEAFISLTTNQNQATAKSDS